MVQMHLTVSDSVSPAQGRDGKEGKQTKLKTSKVVQQLKTHHLNY